MMRVSSNTVLIGQGVTMPKGVFGTTHALVEEFGADRVVEFPISESLMTSMACGAAVGGLRPIIVHQRTDFSLYSFDALINWIALWRFKSGGKDCMPMVIRMIVGRGWGQGPQHSKNFYHWFSSIPGLNVLMPTSAFEAKGLLIEAALKNDPCIFVEHRSLYTQRSIVPETSFRLSYDCQNVLACHERPRLTICFFGDAYTVVMNSIRNAGMNGEVDVIAMPIVAPFPCDSVARSVSRSGRLLVVEPLWANGGVGHRIVSGLAQAGIVFQSPPQIVAHPDTFVPMAATLENRFYLSDQIVSDAIARIMR